MSKKTFIASLVCILHFILYSCTTDDHYSNKFEKGENKTYWDKDQVIKDLQSIPGLLLKFGSKNPNDWEYARFHLNTIGEELLTKEMIKLIEQTKSQDIDVAQKAREKLYKEGKFKILSSKLQSENQADWTLARLEAKSISKEFYDSFIITIILIFKYNSPERWKMAEKELLDMKDEALPYLLQALEHEFFKNKKDTIFLDNISRTVVMFGDSALNVIRQSIYSDSSDIALSFLRSMRYSSNRKILNMLVDVLKYSNKWEYKSQSVESIGHFEYRSKDDKEYAVNEIKHLLKVREEFIKIKTIEALGNIKYGTAIPSLIDILKDNEKWYIKMVAARSLREIIKLPPHIKPGVDPELWSKYATMYYD